jgi:hypothetical protein
MYENLNFNNKKTIAIIFLCAVAIFLFVFDIALLDYVILVYSKFFEPSIRIISSNKNDLNLILESQNEIIKLNLEDYQRNLGSLLKLKESSIKLEKASIINNFIVDNFNFSVDYVKVDPLKIDESKLFLVLDRLILCSSVITMGLFAYLIFSCIYSLC